MIKPFNKPILVTRPFLPPLNKFKDGLQEIWENAWLTNNGPVLRRYTRLLAKYLRTDNVSLFNNGTLALQIGLQGMGISGQVITTPFSFVATTHALFWNKLHPVFVDIEPGHYTLDPGRVEEAITPWTTAILAVHVFGYPCLLKQLEAVARRHNLALIYDAAHAFGVEIGGNPIGAFGDLSMFSFHATKTYHSIEGGLLTFRNPDLQKTFDYLKNFGFESETEVVMPGTNAKMNELQALMGILVLQYLEEIFTRRRRITEIYRARLNEVPGILLPPELPAAIHQNYAYVPVEVDHEEFGLTRDGLYEALKAYNVFSRRYFYPLISDFPCYRNIAVRSPLRVARRVAGCILTLPIYPDLVPDDVHRICDIILHLHRQAPVKPFTTGRLAAGASRSKEKAGQTL